ncbi:ArsR/SmtB family transcription factor [Halanaeroarchaeum sulfurireducens]|uniref:ArsR family transcriptional regulator n=1 Tax=Halanaeroarchaeum sulfurireducens TaxID=1604004 RepID=A0A0F7PD09_9EURY|nr:metalloregulator ArsR/SmtB family transcription factor [Halanaeroarchaeum sulfurireducens]AKH97198.1 ArsR family transcriptional regulator [Halanaeroarchaeum sulfurireducens]
MGLRSERVERHLEDELDECRMEDVETRLSELDMLQSTARSDRVESDLAVLSPLGNETRYRLARVLVEADDELCVCELNAVVDVSESAISHALSDLRDAGLVTRRKDGRWRMYEATPVAFAIIDALDEVHDDE